MTERALLEHVLGHLERAQAVAHLGSWEGLGEDTPLYWSPQAYEIAGWPRDRRPTLAGFLDSVHPDDRPAFLAMRDEALAGRGPYAIDLRIVRPDGDVRHVHLAARIERDDAGTPQRVIGTVQDRTEAVRARRRLAEAEAARRELLRHVLLTVDRERAELAAALERGAGAALAPLIEEIERRVADGALPADADAAVTALRKAQASLRSLASSMEPETETTGDLEAGLEARARSTLPGIHVEVTADPATAVPDHLHTVILRIAHEALHNIAKRSAASTARIHLGSSGGSIVLEVTDDGRGFDPGGVTREPGHLGLTAMRERAELAGGSLQLSSEPGRTVVRALLPKH